MCVVDCRFFRDSPTLVTQIRWYPAQPGARDIGIPTCFFSRRWDRREQPEDLVGELYEPWRRVRPIYHPELFGTGHCGTDEQWEFGCLTTDPVPEVNPNTGHFVCCPAAHHLAGGGGGGGPGAPNYCPTLPGRVAATWLPLNRPGFSPVVQLDFVWTGTEYICVSDFIFDFPPHIDWLPGLPSSTLSFRINIIGPPVNRLIALRAPANVRFVTPNDPSFDCATFPVDGQIIVGELTGLFLLGFLTFEAGGGRLQELVGGGTQRPNIGGAGGGGDVYFQPTDVQQLGGGGGGGGELGRVSAFDGGGGGGGDVGAFLALLLAGGGGGGGDVPIGWTAPLIGGGGAGGDLSFSLPPLRTVAGGGGGGGDVATFVPTLATVAGGGGGGGDVATS